MPWKLGIGDPVRVQSIANRCAYYCHKDRVKWDISSLFPEEGDISPIGLLWEPWECKPYDAIFIGYAQRWDGVYLPEGKKFQKEFCNTFYQVRKSSRHKIVLAYEIRPINA